MYKFYTFSDIRFHFIKILCDVCRNHLTPHNLPKLIDFNLFKLDIIGEYGNKCALDYLKHYYNQDYYYDNEVLTTLIRKINLLVAVNYTYNHHGFPETLNFINKNSESIDKIKSAIEQNIDLEYNVSNFGLALFGESSFEESIPHSHTPKSDDPDKDSFEDIAKSQIQLYKKKNSDYGSATDRLFYKYGFTYYQIMLEQKLMRFNSLLSKDNKPNFESIEDTLLDLSNYAILAVESIRKERKNAMSNGI